MSHKKILLIAANRETFPDPVAPLGLAYLKANLTEDGFEVSVLDLCFEPEAEKAILGRLAEFNPDAVGLSIRNIDNTSYFHPKFYLDQIKQIVDCIKSATAVPLVLGGSGFSLFPEACLKFLGVPFGITGEGEKALGLWLDAMGGWGDLSQVPNLCRFEDGEYLENPKQTLSLLKPPDRSILRDALFFERGGMINLETKRGCRFSCDYCSYPLIHGSHPRCRDPEEVVEELLWIKADSGADHVFFVDDVFNSPAEHAKKVLEAMIKKQTGFGWSCFASPKDFDFELAELMKRAGCQGIEFGSDAGSEATLRGHGKGFGVSCLERSIQACKKAGLPDAHYLIFSGPGEDSSTLTETVRFFKCQKPTALIATLGVRIIPGSALRQRAIKEGKITPQDDLLRPKFYFSEHLGPQETKRLLREQIEKETNWIVPDLGIGASNELLGFLRKQGKKGPLWTLLG